MKRGAATPSVASVTSASSLGSARAQKILPKGLSVESQDGHITVVVRIRPFSDDEVRRGATPILRSTSASVWLTSEGSPSEHCYDSVLDQVSQANVWELMVKPLTEGIACGLHQCVLACGAPGSGKTYSIFGKDEEQGLMLRLAESLCEGRFTKMTYLELHRDRVRDLLHPGGSLEVRQHPAVGAFVQGASSHVVSSVQEITSLLDFGNKMRVLGSTNLNVRAHVVVILEFQQVKEGRTQRAQLRFVDVSGDETGCVDDNSFGALVQRLAGRQVPRESQGSTFLCDPLTGNFRTWMLACVSPGADALKATETTLRLASRAKTLCTNAVKNEEGEGQLFASLQDEVDRLRAELQESEVPEIHHRIAEVTYLKEENESWEKQEDQSERLRSIRNERLHQLPLADESTREAFLVNECRDPFLCGCLRFQLPVWIGSGEACDVVLTGLGVGTDMCSVSEDGLVEVSAKVVWNGQAMRPPCAPFMMKHGDRLRVGTHCFRLVLPSGPAEVSDAPTGISEGVTTFLRESLGSTGASVLLGELRELHYLVEEANCITEELRDDMHETFKAHVLLDEDSPVMCVRVRPGQLECCALDGSTIWSAAKFSKRLEALRCLHQVVSDRGTPWGEATDQNPWMDEHQIPLVQDSGGSRLLSGASEFVGDPSHPSLALDSASPACGSPESEVKKSPPTRRGLPEVKRTKVAPKAQVSPNRRGSWPKGVADPQAEAVRPRRLQMETSQSATGLRNTSKASPKASPKMTAQTRRKEAASAVPSSARRHKEEPPESTLERNRMESHPPGEMQSSSSAPVLDCY